MATRRRTHPGPQARPVQVGTRKTSEADALRRLEANVPIVLGVRLPT
jgi:hypothetical protein